MLYDRPKQNDSPKYYFTYIDKVPEGDVIEVLRSQISKTVEFLSFLSPEMNTYRYAEGKWTIAELLGHMADCERIFTYRGLRIARGDKTPLPGFEQDDYVRDTDFSHRSISSFIDELQAIRASTLCLFENLTPSDIARVGTASGHSFSVRAHPYIIAGHEAHHIGILKERYV